MYNLFNIYIHTYILKLSNIDRLPPCVKPNLKDYYLLTQHLLYMYYSFECKCQVTVLFL